MRTIIAGSRTINDYSLVEKAVAEVDFPVSVIISGTAKGVDKLGEEYAEQNYIPLLKFPANWNKYGKRAGYVRNEEMANNADALIAIWDGKSKGTNHMINIAKKKGLLVAIFHDTMPMGDLF